MKARDDRGSNLGSSSGDAGGQREMRTLQAMKSAGLGDWLAIRAAWASGIPRPRSSRRRLWQRARLEGGGSWVSSVPVDLECLSHVCFPCTKPSLDSLPLANDSDSYRLHISNSYASAQYSCQGFPPAPHVTPSASLIAAYASQVRT